MRKLRTGRFVCTLTAVAIMSGGISVMADEIKSSSSDTYPVAGMTSLIDDYCTTDSSLPSFGVTNAIDEYVKSIIDTDLVATVSQVKDEYKTIVIAQVDGYLNVRKEPDADSEVVGKLQNNSAANITGVVGDWYKISSGTVSGYVMKEYVLFGKSAETLAEQIAKKSGVVKADALNIRSAASKNATVVGVMTEGEKCEVLSDDGEWYKIEYGDTTGYVLGKYLEVTVDMETAESKNEEAVRLAAEEAEYMASIARYASSSEAAYEAANAANEAAVRARTIADGDSTEKTQLYASKAESHSAKAYEYADEKAAEEAEARARAEQARKEAEEAERRAEAERQAAANRRNNSSSSSSSSSSGSSYSGGNYSSNSSSGSSSSSSSSSSNDSYNSADSYSDSSKGQQIANYALQFVGNPYVWGGTSLTNGADCSGFVKSVMSDCGISVAGRTASAQSGGGYTISESQLQPGDLVFYASGGRIYHVAIYIGGGQVVHAASTSLGICVSNYRYATPYKYVRYY